MYLLEKADKAYTSRRGTVHALRDVSVEIPSGSCVTITGPSGSGKTTLLLTLGGLIRPTSGRVLFHGIDLGGLSDAELAPKDGDKARKAMAGWKQRLEKVASGEL